MQTDLELADLRDDVAKKELPLCLKYLDKLSVFEYKAALKNSKETTDSYDPITQQSRFSISAGTSLTYDDTNSGLLYLFSDDTEQSDT